MRVKSIEKIATTCFSAKYRVVKAAKVKTYPSVIEAHVSSGEIKVPEIHVVTSKSDVTLCVSCITTEEEKIRGLQGKG